MKEQYYDELLNIETRSIQKGFSDSMHYNRYEPTPYSALEVLFANYGLKRSDRIVDFGCGKGRLNFYIHYFASANVTGIERNKTFYMEALENRNQYLMKNKKGKDKIHFHYCLAEDYEIDPLDNRFYFFNPFSIQVFMKTIHNILQSVEKLPREIELILYYGSEEYMFFLEYQTPFELKEEIKLPDLYEKNPFERFLIYRLEYYKDKD